MSQFWRKAKIAWRSLFPKWRKVTMATPPADHDWKRNSRVRGYIGTTIEDESGHIVVVHKDDAA